VFLLHVSRLDLGRLPTQPELAPLEINPPTYEGGVKKQLYNNDNLGVAKRQ
jgi:hypothetical protein